MGNPDKSIKFSEQSSRTIHELDNIELHEPGQISRTVQCHSCLKHVQEGLIFCSCGICLRPDEEQIQSIKARVQAMTVSYYLARVNFSRGKRHGEAQWQRDHWKAMNARRGARRKGHDSIVIRWQEDEKYRHFQKVHGWTEFRRHLDHLTMIDISDTAPWHQRHRYESTITLVCNDVDRQAGPMRARKDFKSTPRTLTSLRQEQGRQNFLCPRTREYGKDHSIEALRADLKWRSHNWKTYWSQPSSSLSSQQWWQHGHQRLSMA